MPIDGEEGKRGMIERSERRKNISKKKRCCRKAPPGVARTRLSIGLPTLAEESSV